MKHFTSLLAASALVTAAIFAGPAFTQGAKQIVTLMEIKPLTLASGYRTSKVVGSTVYNDDKEKIGEIDDLIVTNADSVPYAVVSVGGFLGMGKHYVVVPASSLEVIDKQLVLHGGSKESLKALPDYVYTY